MLLLIKKLFSFPHTIKDSLTNNLNDSVYWLKRFKDFNLKISDLEYN